jgi:hypothetical protein
MVCWIAYLSPRGRRFVLGSIPVVRFGFRDIYALLYIHTVRPVYIYGQDEPTAPIEVTTQSLSERVAQ